MSIVGPVSEDSKRILSVVLPNTILNQTAQIAGKEHDVVFFASCLNINFTSSRSVF
jgi:hypothetical protein